MKIMKVRQEDGTIVSIPLSGSDGNVAAHNESQTAHMDIRTAISNLEDAVEDIVVPTKTSELTNDSNFLTSVPVQSVNNKTGAVKLNSSDVGAEAAGTANSTMNAHNTNTSAHNDIRL